MVYTLLGVSILLFITGIMIRYFKWYWLISGYNRLSKEEKANVNIEGLAGYVGNFMFGIAGIFVFSSLMEYLGYKWIVFFAILSIIPLTILLLVKSQKFYKENQPGNGNMPLKTKLAIGSAVMVVLVTGVILSISVRPSQFVFSEESFAVKGSYGISIAYDQIAACNLVEELPKIKMRTNGVSVGNINKGNFTLEGIGAAKLFVYTGNPPYIEIVTQGHQYVFFNDSEKESTKEIYERLQMRLQN